ncbi:MAG: TonB-dependent receptor [Alphaproteobacteria bacterium]|nr:TonB-dependent receptor [Alphaproteobacteria bacterium]
MRVGRVFFCAAIGGFAWATAASAQDATPASDRTGAYELGAIVVNSRPADAVAGQTTLSVTAQQMDQKGARTVDQALDTMPGINVRTGGDGVPRIFLRGLPPRHTQIFLNGVPLNSAVDGQFDPSLIPTEDIARIDVIEGNSSVLYGTGTTGGVIDIITKTGRAGLHGDLRSEAGSGNTYLLSGDTSGADDLGNFFLGGSHASTTGYLLTDGTTRLNSDKERNNLFLNLGRNTGAWTFGLVASLLDASQGIPPSTISSSANDPFAQSQQFERLDAITGGSGQFDVAYEPKGPFSAKFSGYVNALNEIDDRFDNSNFNSMTDPTVKTFHQVVDSVVDGARSRLTYDFGDFGALSAAFGLQHDGEHLGGSIRDVSLGKKQFGIRLLDSNPGLNTYWMATQYNVSPLHDVHLTLGLGANWFDDGTSTRNDGQGMAGVDYDVLAGLQLNASYSRKMRYPTLQELFDAQKGNPALRPERSDDFEVGFKWVPQPLPQALIRVTAFDNHVKNFIENDQTTQIYTNKDTLVRGFEIAPEAQIAANLYVRGGYTFMDTIDQSTGLPVDNRPRHIIHLEAEYRPFTDWAVHGWVSYFADQVVTSKTTPDIQMHMPDYAVVNLRVSRLFPERHARLYVEADNLFNAGYEYSPGLPGPGFMLIGGGEIGF